MHADPEAPWFQSLLTDLRAIAAPEGADEWPNAQLDRLAADGVWEWNIPVDCGGRGWSAADMLQIYRHLARVSLVTTFILTQRNAACQRIETSTNALLRLHLLTEFVQESAFATVGISHLTTSGQHLKTPPVVVTRSPDDRGYLLQGTVPWATGASQARYLITGGTLEGGQQILCAVPLNRPGVKVLPPVELMALGASQTGAVELDSVRMDDGEVLHGPVEKVMTQGTGGGAGSLGTSALALGTAEGILEHLQQEAIRRPDLRQYLAPLEREARALGQQLEQLGGPDTHPAGAAESLRTSANLLVIRCAQVWLAATKGAGYVAGHPAERAIRESMFFLVWSCPQPVLDANLRELSSVTAECG